MYVTFPLQSCLCQIKFWHSSIDLQQFWCFSPPSGWWDLEYTGSALLYTLVIIVLMGDVLISWGWSYAYGNAHSCWLIFMATLAAFCTISQALGCCADYATYAKMPITMSVAMYCIHGLSEGFYICNVASLLLRMLCNWAVMEIDTV